jgi:hypothetical protein
MNEQESGKRRAFGGRCGDTHAAAEYIDRSVSFLNKDASKNGRHLIPFFKFGGRRMYDFDKLDQLPDKLQVEHPPRSRRLERS